MPNAPILIEKFKSCHAAVLSALLSPSSSVSQQAAWVINCQPHDVPVLVAARLLKPLGNPPPNSMKFFAALEVLEQVKDRNWLAKVTNALNQHWQKKNSAKKNRLELGVVSSYPPSDKLATVKGGGG